MTLAPYLIDTHCHLDFNHDEKSVSELVKEAKASGVGKLITINTEMELIEKVQSISEQYPNVYHTIGVHPHDVSKMKPGAVTDLEKAAQHEKCVAIGEIGLDYYYENSPKDIQKQKLKEQLDLALKCELPVVIHTRDAEQDTLDLLTPYAKSVRGRPLGVIHCFTASEAFGHKCIQLGFHISFSGILTFKKAADLRVAAQNYPLNRLLVETDSPFLAPEPYRGKRCEPFMVVQTAKMLAKIRAQSFEEIQHATTKNAENLFKI